MRRPVLVVTALVSVILLAGAGVVAARPPGLLTVGDGAVTSGQQSAVFGIAQRTIRQVRYDDRATLIYAFTLRNDSWYDVQVTGIRQPEREETLLRLRGLTDEDGTDHFTLEAGEQRTVHLRVLMTDCERLSARASSMVSTVTLRTQGVAGLDHDVEVALPEELRTGSAREMFCPLATAKSRPPG
ncbi:MAG TPA: hypothetical protein VFK52_11565 [Nocardioidaceae bacterium]|nr:hypothetical protein [Nocardioidaceae bacterium]